MDRKNRFGPSDDDDDLAMPVDELDLEAEAVTAMPELDWEAPLVLREMARLIVELPPGSVVTILDSWTGTRELDPFTTQLYAWIWDKSETDDLARKAWHAMDAYWENRIRHHRVAEQRMNRRPGKNPWRASGGDLNARWATPTPGETPDG